MAADGAAGRTYASAPCLAGRLGCKLPEQRPKPDPAALSLPFELVANVIIKPEGNRNTHDGPACHP